MDLGTKSSSHFSDIVRGFEKRLDLKNEIKWPMVFLIGFYHFVGVYWSYLHAFPVKWQTIFFAICMVNISGCGITCGVHRLWTHRAYKAKTHLKIFLMLCFTSTGQNSIYQWARDHRLHHKFSDTEADPHNSNRGFFFSHIGWLMMKKNDRVLEKGRQIDMSDILQDPIAMFEHKYSNRLSLITCYILPTMTAVFLWGETWKCALAWQLMRFLYTLHVEMTVNSLAHMFGNKPFNKNIIPTENRFVSLVTGGEGWHNYHHTFPYDYKASETFDLFDSSTFMIRLWAKWGLAYDLKEPSPGLLESVVGNQRDVKMTSNMKHRQVYE